MSREALKQAVKDAWQKYVSTKSEADLEAYKALVERLATHHG